MGSSPEGSTQPALTQCNIQPSMTLREAAPIWLESRRPFIGERCAVDYWNYCKRLCEFFPGVHLDQITGNSIRQYQLYRRQQVYPGLVNHETNILRAILKRARLWDNIGDEDYHRLPMPRSDSTGRALTDEEEYRLFTIGKLNPNWAVVYNVALLSAHTAAGPGEIRHLRLKDVFLGNGDQRAAWIKIREESAKNKYRVRTIPLDRQAFQAAEALLKIAKARGAYLEDHYLLPKKKKRGGGTRADLFDPTQCVTGLQTAWDEMTAAADIKKFRMYDLRHHALTRLAERNSEQVVLKIAGHVSPQMLRKVYAHVRDNAVREAIDTLSRPDGWKPSRKALDVLRPKRFERDEIPALKQQVERIVEESDEKQTAESWLKLMGEE